MVLWWLPALLAAVLAGLMPDTFLDSPGTTIPHEAAYLMRAYIIFGAFAYMAVVLFARAAVHVIRRLSDAGIASG